MTTLTLLTLAATLSLAEANTPVPAPADTPTVQTVMQAQSAKKPVQDSDGNRFYNHYVAAENLTPVSSDLEVIRTFTFESDGRIYTNKIVEK